MTSPLTPLHELYQVIHLPSASFPSPAFVHSSLSRSSGAPPSPSSAPPGRNGIEWCVTLGIRNSKEEEHWYAARLDEQEIQKVCTVEGAAVKASEMPEKVRKCWGEGGLDVRGLDGEEGESPLGAEDEEQVQLIIVITESLRLTIPLRRVSQPSSSTSSLNLLDLAIRLTPGHNTCSSSLASLELLTDRLKNSEAALSKSRVELSRVKDQLADLRKSGGGGPSGSQGAAARGKGGQGSSQPSPRKATPLPSPAPKSQAGAPPLKRRPPPMPKQARIITNDDENGGFLPVSDSD